MAVNPKVRKPADAPITLWHAQQPQHTCLAAFFVYEDEPSTELNQALELVNHARWSLLRLQVDDPIAVSFRVVKLPSLILYDKATLPQASKDAQEGDVSETAGMVETARVFGEQNIIEMIGRVFHE